VQNIAKGYDKLPPILGLLDASMIGIGAMIGAGIFVLPGLAANMAGPAVVARSVHCRVVFLPLSTFNQLVSD
jgi:L-asparagine transporter-like permease